MPITFHNSEGCNFRYAGRRETRLVLLGCIAAEGFLLGDIDVVFCTSAFLLQMNRDWLGHDYHTDIITFDYTLPGADDSLSESSRGGSSLPAVFDVPRGTISGELYIDVETVRDNAAEMELKFENEMHRVVLHGVLHLCGYGDKTPEEEVRMRGLEDKYLRLFEVTAREAGAEKGEKVTVKKGRTGKKPTRRDKE